MKKMRLDRILSAYGYCSRSQVKQFLKTHIVTANGIKISQISCKYNVTDIRIDKKQIEGIKGLYICLHKPTGYVCSHNTNEGPTVYDLLPKQWLLREPKLSCVGRLDKDTSGLLLLTTDGKKIQQLTHPKYHIPKKYIFTTKSTIPMDAIEKFSSGEWLLKGDDKPCKPAKLTINHDTSGELIIHEGKYHQVRRMLASVNSPVETLHRISIGNYDCQNIAEGSYQYAPTSFANISSQM